MTEMLERRTQDNIRVNARRRVGNLSGILPVVCGMRPDKRIVIYEPNTDKHPSVPILSEHDIHLEASRALSIAAAVKSVRSELSSVDTSLFFEVADFTPKPMPNDYVLIVAHPDAKTSARVLEERRVVSEIFNEALGLSVVPSEVLEIPMASIGRHVPRDDVTKTVELYSAMFEGAEVCFQPVRFPHVVKPVA